MCFPSNCLRGIYNSTNITPEGAISSDLFYPQHGSNISINWEDDQHVLDFTFEQRKDGEYQFKYGVARLPYSGIQEVISAPTLPGAIVCNREPIEGVNPYHGNIIYRDDLSKGAKRMIAGMLALKISNILPRNG
ncbi:MAG: hypothetical protein AB1894_17095 [Chloroflexota bacterium]